MIFLIQDFQQTGKASYYASRFDGRLTASGEVFSNDSLTAAHRSLPFGTMVEVSNQANGRSVILRINDRGPFIEGRIIDVTQKAARELGFYEKGLADVRISLVEDT